MACARTGVGIQNSYKYRLVLCGERQASCGYDNDEVGETIGILVTRNAVSLVSPQQLICRLHG